MITANEARKEKDSRRKESERELENKLKIGYRKLKRADQ